MASSAPQPDPSSPVGQLLLGIDQAWHSRSWHGSTLRGALSRVTPEMAAWRPGPHRGSTRPNIWEIAVHCAYWKHIVLRRIARKAPEPFPEAGSDWFPRPVESDGPADAKRWKADLDLLGRIHRELRAAVAGLAPEDLTTFPGTTTTRVDDLVRGIAFHDIHHGGQVQVLKKLWRVR
jgi:uncharacterized damage-inducible protein DinB